MNKPIRRRMKIHSPSSSNAVCKLILMCILCLLLTPSLMAQKQTLSISHKGGIISLFSKIENNSKYIFFYYDELIDNSIKINIDIKNATIEQILNKAFVGTNLTYSIKNEQIIIKKIETSPTKNTKQKTIIKGIVSDETGAPLPGVNVMIHGTNIGTITDYDGLYSLTIPANSIVNFSYIGFINQTINAKDIEKFAHIILIENSKQLDDVIVVGYSTRSREKLISSVSTIDNKQLVQSSVPNLENALTGRVSGVFSRQTTGEPGSDGGDIKIRGFGTALVVVDGIANRDYSSIDPSEIESISVLKDASAAAVYGMQGANGVILITTKRGVRNKKAVLDINTRFGLQVPINYPEGASTTLWQKLGNEYRANMKLSNDRYATITPDEMMTRKYEYNTNWYDVMIKNAPITQSNINVSGGGDRINYFVSVGYLFQDGIWATNSTTKNRFNVRGNIDANITDNLKLSFGVGSFINVLNYPGNAADAIARELKYAAPNFPIYYPEHNQYYAYNGEGTNNPMALADKKSSGYTRNENKSLNIDISLEYKIEQLNGLSLKATLGYTSIDNWRKNWTKNIPYIGYHSDDNTYYNSISASNLNKASLTLSDTWNYNITGQGFINYSNSFAQHTINSGLVFEISTAQHKSFNTSRSDFSSTFMNMLQAGNSSKLLSNSESLREYRSASIIGRASYDYRSTYFIDFNFRYDGAQYFAQKWGFFPSASIGWILTKENFMKKALSVLNEFKIRGSWGELGDLSTAKSHYDYMEQYYFQSGYKYPGPTINIGDRTIYGLEPTINANPDFTWSTSQMANIGIDFKLWKGLLSGSADIFYRQRKGLPAEKANDNAGTLKTIYNLNNDNTRGFEFLLNHDNKIGDFTYFVNANFSWSRTKNGKLEHGQFTNGYSEWRWNGENHWNNVRWGYNKIGNYQSYDDIANAPMHNGDKGNSILLPGDLKYEDWNEDGYIDGKDAKPIGRSAYPELVGGVNIGANWKGIDLSLFWQGGALSNFQLSPFDMDAFKEGKLQQNTWAYFEDRWHRADYTNPNSAWIPGHFPAIREMEQNPINRAASNFWMFKGNYLRLKNIEIGYSLPSNIVKKMNVKQFRIFLNLYNCITFSSQKYFDPEQKSDTQFSLASYPQIMSFNIGLNLKL